MEWTIDNEKKLREMENENLEHVAQVVRAFYESKDMDVPEEIPSGDFEEIRKYSTAHYNEENIRRWGEVDAMYENRPAEYFTEENLKKERLEYISEYMTLARDFLDTLEDVPEQEDDEAFDSYIERIGCIHSVNNILSETYKTSLGKLINRITLIDTAIEFIKKDG